MARGWWLGGWWLVVGGWWLVAGGWWLVAVVPKIHPHIHTHTYHKHRKKKELLYFLHRPWGIKFLEKMESYSKKKSKRTGGTSCLFLSTLIVHIMATHPHPPKILFLTNRHHNLYFLCLLNCLKSVTIICSRS